MIPISDIIPRPTTPIVTVALIAVIAATYGIQLLLPPDGLRQIISNYGVVPAGFSLVTLLTSIVLHHGLLQAASNALALWIFGASVEDRMGAGRFLAFFGVTAVAAGLMDAAARTGSPIPTVGASGAVAALMSAHFVLFPKSRTLVLVPALSGIDLVEIPTLVLAGFWLLFQIAGGVSTFATIGGAIAGALLVWLFRQRSRERVEWWG